MYARRRLCVTLGFSLGLLALASGDGPRSILDGDDPRQFELVGLAPEDVKIRNGEVSLAGRPHGYFATKKSYHNYMLEFEWRYDRPEGLASDAAFHGNSGLLIHAEAPHKIWPKSIEAQLFHPDAGHLFAIHGARLEVQDDPAARRKAAKPVGEWNRQVVACRDGKITCSINGTEVSRGEGAVPDRGHLGWQSEGSPIRFRNLKIRTFD
ncbi:3-keto-disaccharide hydrolase [Singulisphaera sp. PoT]|uniref:3-keto-disaccharide hydrolase n=1 Tax=Singulisphaera sp. PoT TaxID=3411797 RepID=UPI003BF49EAB